MNSTRIKALEVAATVTAAEIGVGRVDTATAVAQLFEHALRIERFIDSNDPSAEDADGHIVPFPQRPAVPIEKSVQPDYLFCLEDGKKLKMLTRYLHRFGLTPDEYRAKWRLPEDYPMTAPNLTATKKTYAHLTGLGKHERQQTRRA